MLIFPAIELGPERLETIFPFLTVNPPTTVSGILALKESPFTFPSAEIVAVEKLMEMWRLAALCEMSAVPDPSPGLMIHIPEKSAGGFAAGAISRSATSAGWG